MLNKLYLNDKTFGQDSLTFHVLEFVVFNSGIRSEHLDNLAALNVELLIAIRQLNNYLITK